MPVGSLERNLRLVAPHEALSHFMPWLPIFVLFTRGAFGLDGALLLAGVQYYGVVVAEVPSGWMSDRVGRVPTLRLAALLFACAQLGFFLSDDRFAVVLGSQLLLSFGFASLSGTNVAFHYDTLEALGRESEFETRQSRITAITYVSMASSALIGGALGLIELRVAFGLAFIVAIAQLAVTMTLTEPPTEHETPAFRKQLARCIRYLDRPVLRWVLVYWIAMVVLEHLAFSLAQPYLTAVLDRTEDDVGATPLLSGALFAGFGVVGALAARAAPRLRLALGVFGSLVLLALASATVITSMAVVVSFAVVPVMLLRSVQGAAATVILSSSVAPMIEQNQRATYFSVHSLAGRAVYGSLLLITARVFGDDLDADLVAFTTVAWTLMVVIVAAWFLLPARERTFELRTRETAA